MAKGDRLDVVVGIGNDKPFGDTTALAMTIKSAAGKIDDVTADSRCPKGEQCIWEGDATVWVWQQKASEAREGRELHTSLRKQGGPREVAAESVSYEVRRLRLDPHPISGRTITKGDYRATIEVTRGTAAAPDR